MDHVLFLLRSASPMAAGLLLSSIWQGGLLTVLVAMCVAAQKNASPAFRSALWTAVLLLMVGLPAATSLLPHKGAGAHAEVHVAAVWSVALVVLWVGASCLQALRLGSNSLRLLRIARSATPVAHGAELGKLLHSGARQAVLCTSPEVNRPSVAGFFRPCILLPVGLAEALSSQELEHVVLHEMEHLRRWDDWLNLLQQLCLVLLPLNPAVRWLDGRLSREREMACDDAVLRSTHARQTYAACLVRLAEDALLRKGLMLALSALGSTAGESELVRRVHRILAAPVAVRGRWNAVLGASAVAIVLMMAGAFLVCSPELVGFDRPVASEVASLRTNGPVVAAVQPVAYMPASALVSAHPMLTSAVLRTTGAAAPGATMRAKSLGHQRSRQKRAARMLPAGLTVSRSDALDRAPGMARPLLTRMSMDGDGTAPEARPRAVVTTFELPQTMYAAVPWQDGWLLLPL